MSQPSAWRAFDEFHFTRLCGFGPNAFGHDFGRNRVLVFAGLFGQIRKWAILRFQVLNAVINFSPIEFVEACDQSFDEIELAIRSEFANEQFADSLRSGDVAADKKSVFLIESVLLPEIDLFAWQVN